MNDDVKLLIEKIDKVIERKAYIAKLINENAMRGTARMPYEIAWNSVELAWIDLIDTKNELSKKHSKL